MDFKLIRSHFISKFVGLVFWGVVFFSFSSIAKDLTLDRDILGPQSIIQFLLTPLQNHLEEAYKNNLVSLDKKDERLVLNYLNNPSCGNSSLEISLERNISIDKKERDEKLSFIDCRGIQFWIRLISRGQEVKPISTSDWFLLNLNNLESLDSFHFELSLGPVTMDFKKDNVDKTWSGSTVFNAEADTFEMHYQEKKGSNYLRRIVF